MIIRLCWINDLWELTIYAKLRSWRISDRCDFIVNKISYRFKKVVSRKCEYFCVWSHSKRFADQVGLAKPQRVLENFWICYLIYIRLLRSLIYGYCDLCGFTTLSNTCSHAIRILDTWSHFKQYPYDTLISKTYRFYISICLSHLTFSGTY